MALSIARPRNKRLFWAGLSLRLLLVAVAVPLIASSWFVPFVGNFIAAPSFDPWTAHLAAGGDPLAFPYGPVMLLVLVPGIALGMLAKALFGIAAAPVVGYGLTLIAVELVCLGLLARLKKGDKPLICLWLSPAVIVVSYWHGQNDLVPVALMLFSLVALRRYHALWAGAALGLAIAAKLSMVLAAPVLAVYLYRNTRLRELLPRFLAGLSGPLLLQLLVFVISAGARTMVLGTPEARKAFQLVLDLGGGLGIEILPVAYLLMLFWTWRLRRMSFDLLLEVLGIVFLSVVLLTPASPGWFIWAAPFFALHAAQTGPKGLILVFGFSALQTIATVLRFSGASIPLAGLDVTAPFGGPLGLSDPHKLSILISVSFAVGLFIALRMWHEGVRRNELYRLSRRAFVLGIAGDSGAGKDTLALSIAGLFGESAVASITGDDYHRWERSRPIWGAVTHLNPRSNDFERMTSDVLRLAAGETVTARHYDHRTGRFAKSHQISFNDVIIVSGLHTLLVPELRKRYDVSIYLDMDEDVRRYFKIRRDVGERGHPLETVLRAIERRVPDAERFIHPQRAYADIVFSIQPANREHIKDVDAIGKSGDVRLKLAVVLRGHASYETLVRTLIGVCGMHVDVNLLDGSGAVEIVIEGDIDGEDIAYAASLLVPNLEELVVLSPEWRGGVTGLMQLVVLAQASRAIRADGVLT